MTTHIFKTILNLTERGLTGTKEFYILFQKSAVDCSWFFFGLATAKKTPMTVYDHCGNEWDLTLFHTDNGEYRIPSLKVFFDKYNVVAGDIIVFEAHEINGQYSFYIGYEKGRYDNLFLWSDRKHAITEITATIADLSIDTYYIMEKGRRIDLDISKIPNGYMILTPFLDSKGDRIPLQKYLTSSEYYSVDAMTHEIKAVSKIRVQSISQ